MNKDRSDNGVDRFLSFMDTVVELVDENKELIEGVKDSVSGGDYEGTLSHVEPLREVTKTEDYYEVIMEVDKGGPLDIKIEEGDGNVKMNIDGGVYKVDVPDNANISDSDAQLNNGVLTVRMPMEDDEDDGVTVSVNDVDGDIEEDEE